MFPLDDGPDTPPRPGGGCDATAPRPSAGGPIDREAPTLPRPGAAGVSRHGDSTTDHVAAGPAPTGPGVGTGVPRFLGGYEILDELARGGMGVVYRAYQVHLDRVVALKVIRDPSLATYAEIRRFRIEAEAVVQLDHPNIVPIYEVGQVDDQPYFSMKLVEGGNLARPLGRFRGRHREAAALMAKVARAVHYAHQRAILHRDLKPSNILIGEGGEPYVADFGLAKRIDAGAATEHTATGAVLGTPAYMSPEQAGGGVKTLTTATDVYSLGATLYEALTGRPPFSGDSAAAILRRVLDEEPPHLRSIERTIDPDLETICLKCLEKSPTRRYGTAEALADDLERWLKNEPIHARPVRTLERAIKWSRRKPALAGFIGVSALALVGLIGGGGYFTYHLSRALDVAERGRYAADMKLGEQAFENGRFARIDTIVKDHGPGRERGSSDRRGFEWHYLQAVSDPEPMTFRAHKAAAMALAFSPDGSALATGGQDGAVRLWKREPVG